MQILEIILIMIPACAAVPSFFLLGPFVYNYFNLRLQSNNISSNGVF